MRIEASDAFWLFALLLAAWIVSRVVAVRRARRPPGVSEQLALRADEDRKPLVVRRLILPDLRLGAKPPLGAPSIVLRRPSPTRHPIVLAHGYMGFAAMGVGNIRQEYFRGVRERLEALGHRVHLVRVAPAGGVELRARQLARQIERLEAERVNIIAHSMGGLDARFAIARLGLSARVSSLTTIGTPHRGTPLADTGALWLGEWQNLRRMLSSLGANMDGLYDLTTRRMEDFNGAVEDASTVFYSSVIGAVTPDLSPVNALLVPGHAYLSRCAGANDGVVPAESQKWGEVLGQVDADHWEQIGWSRRFDAQSFYAVLAEHLAQWGL